VSILLKVRQYGFRIADGVFRQLDRYDELAIDLHSERYLAFNLRQDCFVVQDYFRLLNVSAPNLLEYF
jgi:hypothetical protein